MAYPPGAPIQACEDGTNITPRHISVANMATTGAVPFAVDISDIGNRYTPGNNFTIVLQGGTTNIDFRGFMIQGRVMADDSPAGTFDDGSATDYQVQCNQDTAATHTGREEKTMVELLWIAPARGTGTIYFRYSFVDRYEPTNNMNMFWANLTTNSVMESGAGGDATALHSYIILVVILTTLLMFL
ncbi:putative defense protein [Dysidea avara]|uniref:putative defense protein n=1 Tax=Dysidea avara TaxID=196820 RepID=UPI00332C2EB0